MNKTSTFFLVTALIVISSIGNTQVDYKSKIKQLENGLSNLQMQINQLKNDLGTNINDENAQRITNLESYAVQLNDVLSEVQEQIEENSSEVTRISKAQQNQLNIGIYGTITASNTNGKDSIIDAESFELIFSGQPHDRINYFAELEFERAATVGAARGGEVLLEQAYTDFKINNWINFRGGVLLVPFGNIERDHYAPIRDIISKPLTSYAIAPSDWTDNGFGVNGSFNITENWVADYQAYVIAGLDDNISTTGLRATRQGFGVDNNNNKAFASKLSLQNTTGFSLGLSYYTGAWDSTGSKDISGYNIDIDYKLNWFELVAEYTDMDVDRTLTGTAHMDGYYIRGLISLENLLPNNFIGVDFPHAKLSFVMQYDEVTIENFFDANIANNFEKRFIYGLKLQPTSSWVLKLNYEDSNNLGNERILRGDDELWLLSLGYIF